MDIWTLHVVSYYEYTYQSEVLRKISGPETAVIREEFMIFRNKVLL